MVSNVADLDPKKPRKIGETVFTHTGSRLAPVRQLRDSGWFRPLMATLPVGAFVLVYFW